MAVYRCLLDVSITIACPFLTLKGKFCPRYIFLTAKTTIDYYTALMRADCCFWVMKKVLYRLEGFQSVQILVTWRSGCVLGKNYNPVTFCYTVCFLCCLSATCLYTCFDWIAVLHFSSSLEVNWCFSANCCIFSSLRKCYKPVWEGHFRNVVWILGRYIKLFYFCIYYILPSRSKH